MWRSTLSVSHTTEAGPATRCAIEDVDWCCDRVAIGLHRRMGRVRDGHVVPERLEVMQLSLAPVQIQAYPLHRLSRAVCAGSADGERVSGGAMGMSAIRRRTSHVSCQLSIVRGIVTVARLASLTLPCAPLQNSVTGSR